MEIYPKIMYSMRSLILKLLKPLPLLMVLILYSCGEKKAENKKQIALESAEKSRWVSIFNGKDLTGWTMKINGYPLGENFGNTFRVENGILSIRYDAYGKDFNSRFGALYFDKPLSDYRLKVTYRFVGETAPGAPEWGYRDSGIQFHGQPPGTQKLDQLFPICLEYNLHGGNGNDDRPVGAVCANGMFVEVNGGKNKSYCTPPSVEKTFHGDQWVTAEIDVRAEKIRHFVNGGEILSYANPIFDRENEIAVGFILNGDPTVKGGYVSLQSNSHPIDFREIELMHY